MSIENEKELEMISKYGLKDVVLAKKQGEALERVSTPLTNEEALSLGYYDSTSNLALNTMILVERLINNICGVKDTPIAKLAYNISRSSGNRQAKRMEKTLETIAALGQYMPFQNQYGPLAPEKLDLNE